MLIVNFFHICIQNELQILPLRSIICPELQKSPSIMYKFTVSQPIRIQEVFPVCDYNQKRFMCWGFLKPFIWDILILATSFNFLHHDFIYETERYAWPSYGKKKNEIGNIISALKMMSDQIMCQLKYLCGCKFQSHLGQKHVSVALYRYR